MIIGHKDYRFAFLKYKANLGKDKLEDVGTLLFTFT